MPRIKEISAHKIVNSRGDWTVDARVELDNGIIVEHPVPEGVSKGENEAVYLSADKSVQVISTVIADALEGEDPVNQSKIDKTLIEMDGTPNKNHLGGNSILAVSIAISEAAAQVKGVELYEHIAELFGSPVKKPKFPTPVFNILNGGKHAHNNLSFQEFMVIPAQGKKFPQQMEIGLKVYDLLESKLLEEGQSGGVGDEGGFAPTGFNPTKALEFIALSAGETYELGKEVFLGMDVAAESFVDDRLHYTIKEEDLDLDVPQFINYYKKLIEKYPLIYIEDPFFERDYEGWEEFYKEFSEKLMVVADDLVVTNTKFLQKAIDKKLANAVIVKPNQVGTVTETLDFIKMAQNNSMSICVSHRSGDTAEDTFIADLALGVGAEFIKSGAPVRGERVAKYNRLLDIYSTL
ncbi:enolase [Patescibacteria group bacterium]